jgi:hypothetical protein
MRLSRKANECLKLLRWFAARFGDVYPKQETIARHLKLKERHVRNVLTELKKAGLVVIEKSGPRAATYKLLLPVRLPVFLPVKVPVYGFRSLYNLHSATTSAEAWPKPMGTATQNSPEMERVFQWAEEHGYKVKNGADLFRVMEAMEAA